MKLENLAMAVDLSQEIERLKNVRENIARSLEMTQKYPERAGAYQGIFYYSDTSNRVVYEHIDENFSNEPNPEAVAKAVEFMQNRLQLIEAKIQSLTAEFEALP